MYDELINKYEIEYSAGGATQNTMRFCEWVLGKNNLCTVFLGCVGDDYFGKIMQENAKADGVKALYQIDEEGTPTGTCAVCVTDNGKSRSLCAYLGASNKLSTEYLSQNWALVENAEVFYTTGHVLAVSPQSALKLAKYSHEWGKEFLFNLAATYVSHKYSKELMELLPFIDLFFGNADEVQSFATVKGYHVCLYENIKIVSFHRNF